jgi:hypothetical protein
MEPAERKGQIREKRLGLPCGQRAESTAREADAKTTQQFEAHTLGHGRKDGSTPAMSTPWRPPGSRVGLLYIENGTRRPRFDVLFTGRS